MSVGVCTVREKGNTKGTGWDSRCGKDPPEDFAVEIILTKPGGREDCPGFRLCRPGTPSKPVLMVEINDDFVVNENKLIVTPKSVPFETLCFIRLLTKDL